MLRMGEKRKKQRSYLYEHIERREYDRLAHAFQYGKSAG